MSEDTPVDDLQTAVSGAIDSAGMSDEEKQAVEKEQKTVDKLWKSYNQAREFDKGARAQYAIDRRYAAGTADETWAVNTNLIGSYIDILVSFLYARDPDVSCKKAPRVDNGGSKEMDIFAKTMELVISSLWKHGRLKPQIKKAVRSALSVGNGWIKAVLICDAPENAEMQSKLNDIRDNLGRLEDVKRQLAAIENVDMTKIDELLAEQQELVTSIEDSVEATIRKYLAIDFVPSQDIATSLDVAAVEDYLDADWNANAIYILKDEAQEKFPRLSKEEVKGATSYYQRRTHNTTPLTDQVALPGIPDTGVAATEADYYTSAPGTMGSSDSDNGPAFVKVVELWDKRTNHIKTMIEGIKRWAKEPFQPPYPSSRFYPYFRIAFFEVDGERHSQSLSWRLRKLQDEYARSRSNFRLTRERSIPGTFFNKAAVSPDDAGDINKSVHMENIGIMLINPDTPMQNVFMEKPVPAIDARLFDNSPIVADMEKISGVQEALQSSATADKTATQAEIEQSGFASRTTADRDVLEDMLTDLANYTGQVALGGLNQQDAQRIAGPAAFWPHGMAVDDLVTMVELQIKAGSTGKPNAAADQQAWGVVMPALKEAIMQVNQAVMVGNLPLAKGLSELIKRTMKVMGDETDPETFLPPIPELPLAPMGAPLPGAVGPNGAPLDGTVPPLPPTAGSGEGGAPALENPVTTTPEI